MPPPDWGEADLLTIAAAGSTSMVVKLLLKHGVNLKETQALHAAATTSGIEMDDRVYQTVTPRIEFIQILLDT